MEQGSDRETGTNKKVPDKEPGQTKKVPDIETITNEKEPDVETRTNKKDRILRPKLIEQGQNVKTGTNEEWVG